MDKQLQLFSATLESWLLVQRGWLKLEAVFAAPDIQRQVPGEAAAFAQVDKTFKDIMRRTHDRPNALQVLDDSQHAGLCSPDAACAGAARRAGAQQLVGAVHIYIYVW